MLGETGEWLQYYAGCWWARLTLCLWRGHHFKTSDGHYWYCVNCDADQKRL